MFICAERLKAFPRLTIEAFPSMSRELSIGIIVKFVRLLMFQSDSHFKNKISKEIGIEKLGYQIAAILIATQFSYLTDAETLDRLTD